MKITERILLVTLLAASIAGCQAQTNSSVSRPANTNEVTSFHCGNGREVVISADKDNSQAYYYTIRLNGSDVVPRTLFTTSGPAKDSSKPGFGLTLAENGNLIGISANDHPEKFLIMHDFASNTSYPRTADLEQQVKSSDKTMQQLREERRQAMEKRLKAVYRAM